MSWLANSWKWKVFIIWRSRVSSRASSIYKWWERWYIPVAEETIFLSVLSVSSAFSTVLFHRMLPLTRFSERLDVAFSYRYRYYLLILVAVFIVVEWSFSYDILYSNPVFSLNKLILLFVWIGPTARWQLDCKNWSTRYGGRTDK